MLKTFGKYIDSILYQSQGWRGWIILTGISAIVIAIFFIDSSPLLKPLYSGDSACFFIIGKGWSEGYLPYVDYFDHKGPLLYAFYALAYIIGGSSKWGMFAIQSLLLGWILWMLRDIAHQLHVRPKAFIVALSFFLIYCVAFGVWPYSEFFSLPFQVLALYVFSRRLSKNEMCYHSYQDTLIYGLALGAIAMIRINNTCLNIAVLLVLIYIYLRYQMYMEILINAFAFIGGFLIAIAPFIGYFYLHDALDDMIYSNYTFNMMYRLVNSYGKWRIYNSIFLLPVVAICMYAYWKNRDKLADRIMASTMIVASVLCTMVYINGAPYEHYFLILSPIIFTAYCLICKSHVKCLDICILIISIFFVGKDAFNNCKQAFKEAIINNKEIFGNLDGKIPESRCEELTKVINIIPVEEQSYIFCDEAFEFEEIFQIADVMPINKYFNLPKFLMKIDPAIEDSINVDIEKTDPLWIITSSKPSKPIEALIREDFQRVNGSIEEKLYIYRRKDI